ncbi:hypothetical protein ACEN9J_02845 [Variovorax sp. Varisp41]|uniref:hypothetical protein n=1 Tax=Variovorax sp. Varisp41 TaxID=3243033 RepID=UPI0039B6A15D
MPIEADAGEDCPTLAEVRSMSRSDLERLRTLADRLDCLTEADVILLAKASPATVETWRKRGTGPEHIFFGNRPLYPKDSLKKFLDARRKPRYSGNGGVL